MKRLIKEYESIIWWFGLNERMVNGRIAKKGMQEGVYWKVSRYHVINA